MKLIYVKVLPILLVVLVGAKGAIVLTKPSGDVYTSLSRLTHDSTDLIKEGGDLKSEIDDLKETVQSPANLSESLRNIPKSYTSCVEALQNGADSGIYKLQLPFSGLDPFDVYCLRDPENGPAWTVVQRRQDGSVDFYRTWSEYKFGFGNLIGEFFLGLKYLYALTNQLKPQQLWIQLADWEGATKTAKYSLFQIGPESTKYNMTQLGVYSGNAEDSLTYHLGAVFSTKDSDTEGNCAQARKGAWWFKTCMRSDLNGQYLYGELPENSDYFAKGINWYYWRGDYYSNKYAHMALRPSN